MELPLKKLKSPVKLYLMDGMFLLVVTVSLLTTLAIVGFWQGKIEKAKSTKTLADMKEAKSKGKNKALAQYPLIEPTLCIGCGTCIEACPEDQVIGLVDGIARIVNGSRCIGVAKCEAACPVGAITVGLGDISSRIDMPILTPTQETNVAGLYLAGELSGIGLVKQAIDQGVKVMNDIDKKLKEDKAPKEPGVRDVFIVGAGPAGITCTLRAIELKLDYKTISQDDLGGTVGKYPRRKMTIVQSCLMPLYGKIETGVFEKETLIEWWSKALKENKAEIEFGTSLNAVTRAGAHFEIKTSKGTEKSRFVILALGRRGTPRKLGVPGEDLNKVLYALVDAATYTKQNILVVGGGDSAIEAATGLAEQEGNVVALSYRKEDFFRIKPRNEQRIKDFIAKGRVKALLPSEVLKVEADSVALKAPKENPPEVSLPNNWVFVFAGGDPPFPLLKSMGIRFGGEQPKPKETPAVPAA